MLFNLFVVGVKYADETIDDFKLMQKLVYKFLIRKCAVWSSRIHSRIYFSV